MAAMKIQTVAQRRDKKTGKAKGHINVTEMIIITCSRDARRLTTGQLEDILLQGEADNDPRPPHPFSREAHRELRRRDRRRGRQLNRAGQRIPFTSTFTDLRDRLRHATKMGHLYQEMVQESITDVYGGF